MEAGGCQVLLPRRVHPELRVLAEVDDRNRNGGRVDPDAHLPRPVLTGPVPNVAEHLLVEAAQVHVIEYLVWSARRGESQRMSHVVLLGGVQLPTSGDVRGSRSVDVLVTERCMSIPFREERVR